MTSQAPHIVLTGGGTGGHIFPALTVGAALRQQLPEAQIDYVGQPTGLEFERATKAGFPFTRITFSGMPRGLTWRWAAWLLQGVIATGTMLCRFIGKRPKVVFATGGYVTAPVLAACVVLGISYVLHEPDAMPGLVNRLFCRWAAAITCAFTPATQVLGTAKTTVTGNPVRTDIGTVDKAAAQQLLFGSAISGPCVLVMGGSQGAASINQAVANGAEGLHSTLGATVLHQVGAKHWQRFKEEHPSPSAYYQPVAFIEDMPTALAAANVVLCRSGSITLSELAMAGVPAVLVPYPHAAANHQYKNAMALVNDGAAVLLADRDLSAETVISHIERVLTPEANAAMRKRMQQRALPQATETIASRVVAIACD